MIEPHRSHQQLKAEAVIDRYMDQPPQLPAALKAKLRKEFPKESLRLYACVDLNSSFQLEEAWLILLSQTLILATRTSAKSHQAKSKVEAHCQPWQLFSMARSDISEVYEVQGLSCSRTVFLGRQGQSLLTVRYSQRQNRNVSAIRFVLEQDQSRSPAETITPEATYDSDAVAHADQFYQKQLLSKLSDAQASVASSELAVIWRLLSYLKPYRRQVTWGLFGAVFMTLVSLVPAFLTGHLIDGVIKPLQANQMGVEQAKTIGMALLIGLASVLGLREFFAWIRLRTLSVLGEYVARDLRDDVYTHLHRLSLRYFSSKQTGSIISRVSSDTDRIWDFIAFGVAEVTTSVLMLIGLSSVLLWLDWPLGLVVTLPVPVILWIIARHGQHMQQLFLRAWRKWSKLSDCLSDTVPGIKVVKAFHRHDREIGKFKRTNQVVLDGFNEIHFAWTSFWPKLILSIQALVVVVWAFGLPRIMDHVVAFRETGDMSVGLSPGTFVSFVLYLSMFVQPIEVIGQMARMVNRATSSAHRVFEVLDTEPQKEDSPNGHPLPDIQGKIKFENVSFSYDGLRKIIKDMNFEIEPGEMIGLVGSSGGGKTTLINLLARFYSIDRGRILIDGKNLNKVSIADYRNQLGMVLQDPYLFHGSILENIRYAQPEAEIDQVIAAAKAANAHDFICRLPHAYDTMVGERGQNLSGGERQRISIARAILRNPRILILDEATSAVDTETEKKIQQALDRLVKGRTVIAIAHRLSTLQKADRIFVIDKGELAETGSHIELMTRPYGIYRKLVDLQNDLHRSIV